MGNTFKKYHDMQMFLQLENIFKLVWMVSKQKTYRHETQCGTDYRVPTNRNSA